MVDTGGKVHLLDDLDEYKATVGPRFVVGPISIRSLFI
jgi:hypothetical protein